MTQMGVAIDGGAADIHAHIGGVERLEALFLARQRIVNNQFRFHILILSLLIIGCKDTTFFPLYCNLSGEKCADT
jgi:hypothetical protein